ncbi:MobC family plasmid mobilization relaxosome protein [Enterococcus gallinarum]|uniref:MobC family plasmid mobilization relaxosome protein n=1 Tax=Enterococcus gallinarum TaxID=1353 RepID=UPI00214B9A55|nr:MobC family plasmid mobilization relaxosome protein [Enterococcus gallinarum]
MLRLPETKPRPARAEGFQVRLWARRSLAVNFSQKIWEEDPMPKNLFRNEHIKVYVTEDEKNLIRKNMNASSLRTLTNYVRLMALNGRVIKIDFETLKDSLSETGKYVYELNKIGNNINQISHKLNQTDIVEKEDIEYLVSEFEKMKANYLKAQQILLKEINKLTRTE